ncbi:MAG: LCP family protein [Gaiellaceae bacterium]|jgi:LCP family protein required for cell wall assembly
MRTTLKRRIGRWEQTPGDGRAAASPSPARAKIRHYEQPRANKRVLRAAGRFLLTSLLVLTVAVGGAAGGFYLWAHQAIGQTAATSPGLKKARGWLDKPLPNHPVIALVIGCDRRVGMGGDRGRSDTLMLVRADPRKATRSITLLSFPRDLRVPLYCNPSSSYGTGKINAAYSTCGFTGSLLTVKNLTNLPINYVMAVYFRGFRKIVDHMGGVWLDIDRRYYNRNVHTAATDFANINLQPGYQRLNGSNALDYVRYRHGDSDLYRIIRQQAFIRSFREQASKLSISDYISILNTITHNVEIVNGGGHSPSLSTTYDYARLAYGLPSGHLIQVKIENTTNATDGSWDILASPSSIQKAVEQFANPDLTAADQAARQNHVLRTKSSTAAAPAPAKTTVLVLNASGTAGLARDTSSGLALRGYKVIHPTGGVAANFPGTNIWHSIVYYDPAQRGSKAAAKELATFFDPADMSPINAKIAPLANGAMVVAALGRTFDGTLPPIVPKVELPSAQPPRVRIDPGLTAPVMRRIQGHFGFRLEAPYRVESSSYLAAPPRVYWMVPKQLTVRLTFKMSGYLTGYWGIQETKWSDAPVLAGAHITHSYGGRSFDLYYQGVHLHMIVLHQNGASYWVVNTLDDMLSNETMISIARNLRLVSGRLAGQHAASSKRVK